MKKILVLEDEPSIRSFVVINLIVDLLYFAVDPRLRVEKPGGH